MPESLLGRTVLVTWADSTEHYGWHYTPLASKLRSPLVPITSVGFVIQENADNLLLAHSIGQEGNAYLGVIQIPRGAIKSLKDIFPDPPDPGSNNTNGHD